MCRLTTAMSSQRTLASVSHHTTVQTTSVRSTSCVYGGNVNEHRNELVAQAAVHRSNATKDRFLRAEASPGPFGNAFG